jgi:pyruvate kinase
MIYAKVNSMKKNESPKICCTLGYSTDGLADKLIMAGMDSARINTAYCTFEEYDRRITEVRDAAAQQEKNVPIMIDLKGPQLRLITNDPAANYKVEKGQVFPLGYKGVGDFDILIFS